MIVSKPRSKSQSQSRGKIRGFNTKGYFYNVEPFCQQYLKAKHATYEKSRQLRQRKNEGKENNPVMFQFNRPKAGFYLLRGCKIDKIDQRSQSKNRQRSKQNQVDKQYKGKSEYLSYFLKKYTQRKQKLQKNATKQSMFPIVKPISQPYQYPMDHNMTTNLEINYIKSAKNAHSQNSHYSISCNQSKSANHMRSQISYGNSQSCANDTAHLNCNSNKNNAISEQNYCQVVDDHSKSVGVQFFPLTSVENMNLNLKNYFNDKAYHKKVKTQILEKINEKGKQKNKSNQRISRKNYDKQNQLKSKILQREIKKGKQKNFSCQYLVSKQKCYTIQSNGRSHAIIYNKAT